VASITTKAIFYCFDSPWGELLDQAPSIPPLRGGVKAAKLLWWGYIQQTT